MKELKVKAHIYMEVPDGMSEEDALNEFYTRITGAGLDCQVYEQEVQQPD